MWGLRKKVSLLLDHGHLQARQYPVGMVWEEAQIVVNRWNQEEASRAALLNKAVAALLSKNGGQAFKKTLKELTDG